MNETEKLALKNIFEAYKKSELVMYGSPDQFQFRKNQLLTAIADFILCSHEKECEEMCNELKENEPKHL